MLLISTKEGDKFKATIEELLSFINEISSREEKEKNDCINLDNLLKVFGDSSSINLVKPLNIANSTSIEKEIKDIGTIYCSGDKVRILTSKGWKSLKFED